MPVLEVYPLNCRMYREGSEPETVKCGLEACESATPRQERKGLSSLGKKRKVHQTYDRESRLFSVLFEGFLYSKVAMSSFGKGQSPTKLSSRDSRFLFLNLYFNCIIIFKNEKTVWRFRLVTTGNSRSRLPSRKTIFLFVWMFLLSKAFPSLVKHRHSLSKLPSRKSIFVFL